MRLSRPNCVVPEHKKGGTGLSRADDEFRRRNRVHWLQVGGGKAALYSVKPEASHKDIEQVASLGI